MSLTELKIRYDPEYPFDWVSCEPPEYGAPKPRFPYRGWGRSGCVTVLGINFDHRHVVTGGFDPYAGEEWTCDLGPFTLTLTSVICEGVKLKWSFGSWSALPWDLREMMRRDGVKTWGSWEVYGWENIPWIFRRLWAFLEWRKTWYEHNVPEPEEDYPYVEYE